MQKQTPIKNKVQEVLLVCHSEIKKTTQIGKKMLMASKTSNDLHAACEELGQIVASAYAKGELDLPLLRARELAQLIKSKESELCEIEKQMNKIKFSSGPENVSKDQLH